MEHLPVFPSFGVRFESEHGVITFSGDTAETPNMVALSRDADLLVHEVVTMDYYRDQDFTEEFLHHLESGHTTPEGLGRITAARVQKVVVSHLAGVFSDADLAGIAESYDGPYTLGADRQLFSVWPGAGADRLPECPCLPRPSASPAAPSLSAAAHWAPGSADG